MIIGLVIKFVPFFTNIAQSSLGLLPHENYFIPRESNIFTFKNSICLSIFKKMANGIKAVQNQFHI